jgi:hypothetical protein
VAAGLQEHLHADSPPAHSGWSPCQQCSDDGFGGLLAWMPCTDPSHGPAATAAPFAFQQQQQQYALATDLQQYSNWQQDPQQPQKPQQQPQPQQQQQQVARGNSSELQWVPTPQPDPVASFSWPCPDELKGPLITSTMPAAAMIPLVFPATPAAAAAAAQAGLHRHSSSSSVNDSAPADTPAVVPQRQFTPSVAASADSASSAAASAVPPASAGLHTSFAPVAAAAAAPAGCLWVLSPPVRSHAEAVARYRAKRARRSSVQRVRYQRRKDYADKRPRVGGRFIKMTDLQQPV